MKFILLLTLLISGASLAKEKTQEEPVLGEKPTYAECDCANCMISPRCSKTKFNDDRKVVDKKEVEAPKK